MSKQILKKKFFSFFKGLTGGSGDFTSFISHTFQKKKKSLLDYLQKLNSIILYSLGFKNNPTVGHNKSQTQ